MLKKRIIPCLDIQNGRTVKGINFVGIRDAGDPVTLAKKYAESGADELVFLDITATVEKRKTLVSLVQEVSFAIDIPFTVGGGINSLKDAALVIEAGADKVSLNSAAIQNPQLISQIAKRYGSQCVVVAIDTCFQDDWNVFIHGGRTATAWKTRAWAQEVSNLGAGEILLTSMNNDGTKSGFSLEITEHIASENSIPIIASGGAGSTQDFLELFTKTSASAGLAASIFHYGEVAIPTLKNMLYNNGIPIRKNTFSL